MVTKVPLEIVVALILEVGVRSHYGSSVGFS